MPLQEPRTFSARIGWPEPIGRTEDIAAATMRLLATLCRELERRAAGRAAPGARAAPGRRQGRPPRRRHRPAGARARCTCSACWPSSSTASTSASASSSCCSRPWRRHRWAPPRPTSPTDADAAELDRLVDQLAQRLGAARVVRLQPVDSHLPERAQALVPAGIGAAARAPGSPASRGPCACSPTPSRSRPWPACPTARPLAAPPPRAAAGRRRHRAGAHPARMVARRSPAARATTTASPPRTAAASGSAARACTASHGRRDGGCRGDLLDRAAEQNRLHDCSSAKCNSPRASGAPPHADTVTIRNVDDADHRVSCKQPRQNASVARSRQRCALILDDRRASRAGPALLAIERAESPATTPQRRRTAARSVVNRVRSDGRALHDAAVIVIDANVAIKWSVDRTISMKQARRVLSLSRSLTAPDLISCTRSATSTARKVRLRRDRLISGRRRLIQLAHMRAGRLTVPTHRRPSARRARLSLALPLDASRSTTASISLTRNCVDAPLASPAARATTRTARLPPSA